MFTYLKYIVILFHNTFVTNWDPELRMRHYELACRRSRNCFRRSSESNWIL